MNDEQNHVILITGTSKGIGNYLINYYASKGMLTIGCSRSSVKSTLENYVHFEADITKEEDVQKLIENIKKKYGKLDILINNAGIASMNHYLLTPVNTVDKIFDTNFKGTFLLCREAARLMRKNNFGRIVNFGTIAVPLNLEGESIYASSKSAVITFSKIIARELASFNITCNVVCPTPIDTDLIRGVPKDKIQKIIENLPIKRMGTFEDVTNVIDFFIKKESEYITGQVIYLGGLS